MSATPTADVAWNDPSQRVPLIMLVVLTVALVAAYWDMFSLVMEEWANPLYSHGYIVPIISLALLWLRYQPFRPVPAGERWIGLGVLVLGLAVRSFGVYMTMNPLDRYSFLIAIFGVFMMVGGLHTIRWAWPDP